MPDQDAAARHLGRDRVVLAAVVGGVVVPVGAGDDPRRAVGLGEVGERPHRVADGRDVRLRDRQELVVGVDRLRDLAGQDRDRAQRRDQATRVEHRLDEGQHARVDRHALPDAAEREQVVDPQRPGALEGVAGRLRRRRTPRGRAARPRARRGGRARSRPRRSCSRPRRAASCVPRRPWRRARHQGSAGAPDAPVPGRSGLGTTCSRPVRPTLTGHGCLRAR